MVIRKLFTVLRLFILKAIIDELNIIELSEKRFVLQRGTLKGGLDLGAWGSGRVHLCQCLVSVVTT